MWVILPEVQAPQRNCPPVPFRASQKQTELPKQVLHDCIPSPGSPQRNMMLLKYPSPQHLNGFRAKMSTRTRAPLEAQHSHIQCRAWENRSQWMNSELSQKASASALRAASIRQAQAWRNSLSRSASPFQGLQTPFHHGGFLKQASCQGEGLGGGSPMKGILKSTSLRTRPCCMLFSPTEAEPAAQWLMQSPFSTELSSS